MSFQVFLSYARNDDLPLPGGESKDRGFITTLLKALEVWFADFGPPTPYIYRDTREIAKSDQFDPVLQEELSRSQALLVVLSNNWIHRDWCLKELNLFEQRWKNLDERSVKSKVFVVGKNYIDPSAFPPLLQGQDTYKFYEKDDERAGRYREFFRRGGQSAEFHDRVEELARDLWSKARVGEIPTEPSRSQPQPRGRIIYLAKPAKDVDAAYLRLVDELQNGGYEVVPDRKDEMPEDAAAATAWVDAALKNAELSIHLLGEKERFVSVDDATPLVSLQLQRAALRGEKDDKFRRIIWAPRIFNEKERDDSHEVLKKFSPDAERDKIDGSELSKFVDFVVDHLRNTVPRPARSQPLPADARVYIYHKLEDTAYATSLAKALKEKKVEPWMPAFDGTQAELTAYHREQLRKCDAVVVCWGPNASEAWAKASASETANWKEFERERDYSCRALVAGPPPGVRKEALIELPPRSMIDLVLDLTAYERPTAEALGPLIDPLFSAPR